MLGMTTGKMGAPRRRNIIKSRKRVQEDGEEEGEAAQTVEDDSMSENSVGSDADDDADAEASDDSSTEASVKGVPPIVNGHRKKLAKSPPRPVSIQPGLTATADTEAMLNGLKISPDSETEEIQFDQTQRIEEQQAHENQPSSSLENPIERRRREHEEYRKRRDADPAFVPNRGGFFMHDHRTTGPGQNGFRFPGRGAGRGRTVPRGPFQGLRYVILPPTLRYSRLTFTVTCKSLALKMPLGLMTYMIPLRRTPTNFRVVPFTTMSSLSNSLRLL